MRGRVGGLIGKIRLHRTRGQRVEVSSSTVAAEQSPEDTRAQRIEVFSDDSKLLRNLLVGMAVLSFIFIFQANERIEAVRTMNDAHGSIAVEAVVTSRLTGPATFTSSGVGTAAPEIEILPKGQGRPELIADVAAQAMLELERSGFMAKDQWVEVSFFSPTLNSKVKARLQMVERPPRLGSADAEGREALLLEMSKTLPGRSRRSEMEANIELVEQRCPSKWLKAGSRYSVSTSNSPWTREVQRLQMGSATWMLSDFQAVNDRGATSPLVDAIATPWDFRMYFFRTAEPSFLDELSCEENFVLRWGYEYMASAKPVLLGSVTDEGYLALAFKESIEDARRRLNKLSVRLTEGIDVGTYGVFFLIPLAMTVLSVWLSIILRRLAVDTGGRIRQLLVVDPSRGRRQTALDGPHFFYVERFVRAACLAYPIIAPPLVALSFPFLIHYPDMHIWWAQFFGDGAQGTQFTLAQAADVMLKTPAFYVAVMLFVQAAHQLLLVFSGQPRTAAPLRS